MSLNALVFMKKIGNEAVGVSSVCDHMRAD